MEIDPTDNAADGCAPSETDYDATLNHDDNLGPGNGLNEVDTATEPKELLPPELISRSLNDQQFEEFYMQQVTKQFGDDLDKLRQSKDFNEKSLVLLIDALQQGTNIFDRDQRAVILGGIEEKTPNE